MTHPVSAEHRTVADNLRWLAGHLDEPAFDMPGCAHWLKHAADLLDATPGATLSGEASELSGEASRPRELLPSKQYLKLPLRFVEPVTDSDWPRIVDAEGFPVANLFWPAHPADETEQAEQATYALGRAMAAAGGALETATDPGKIPCPHPGCTSPMWTRHHYHASGEGWKPKCIRDSEVKTSPRYGIPEVLAFLRERTEWLRKEDKHFAADECDYIRQCIEDTSSRLSPGLAEQIADAQRRIAAWPPDVRAAMGLPDTRGAES